MDINCGDRVCVWDGEHDGQHGVVVGDNYDGEPDLYVIEFDDKSLGDAILMDDEFEVEEHERTGEHLTANAVLTVDEGPECPRCHNSEHPKGARFCMICGMPLSEER